MIDSLQAKKNSIKLENIAIIGSGGRENSLAWAIQKNDFVNNIFLIPGNGGSSNIRKTQCIDLNYENSNKLILLLNKLNIDLIIIGPETPLAAGLADTLRKADFLVFGPNQDGAQIEASKSWAKNFMRKANIPTADYWIISNYDDAKHIINNSKTPIVVKVDGLAQGKGVFLPETKRETLEIIESILNGKFGNAGNTIVLEERIQGPEISIFAICDGKNYVLLPSAQDHKRLEEKDQGLNTGGMGAYAPTPLLSENDLLEIKQKIIAPTIDELIKKNIDYRGVLYFGLMITKLGPKVIEYNCRFGDPECQTIMPLMNKDFVTLLQKCASGNLKGDENCTIENKVSGCVITCSKGYPLSYEVGFPIFIDNNFAENLQIFHSGTLINSDNELVTNGGRVLSIVCQAENFDKAFDNAYTYIKQIKYQGKYYRKDIGNQVRSKNSLDK
tara:strand:+ start:1415 stop:2746 length:1332 start_codon:yes stop_codon:yes gene_type:complete